MLLAFNTNTGSLTLYVLSTNSSGCGAIVNNSVVSSIAQAMSDLFGTTVSVAQCGNPITDSFSLARNNNVDSPLCIIPLFFFYLFGTQNAYFN